jgi:hypothetical protein
MAVSLRAEAGIVIGTCSGTFELDAAKEGAQRFWERAEWRGKPIVWDLRSAELAVNATQVRELGRSILSAQPSPPPPKVAFVTGRDVDFGIVRMFEVFREDPATNVRVFRDYEAAIAWAARSD